MKVHQIIDLSFDVNLYFVDAPKPVLIDSGLGGDGRRIASLVFEMLAGRKLEALILTHRHIDHTGGAAEIMSKFSTEVYASPGEAPSLIEGDQITTGAITFGTELIRMPVKILMYNKAIDIGEGELLAIHTPGHTEGSICLFHEKSKSIFSGDVVFTGGNVGRWDLATGDYGQLVRSIQKLSEMDVKNLYPGHGPYTERDALDHINMGLNALKTFAW